jgi:uncharacterized membrane protein
MKSLTVVGFIVVFAGLAIIAAGSSQGGGTIGGVIFVGPFPFVFGEGPSAGILVLASVLIALVIVILLVFGGWVFGRNLE